LPLIVVTVVCPTAGSCATQAWTRTSYSVSSKSQVWLNCFATGVSGSQTSGWRNKTVCPGIRNKYTWCLYLQIIIRRYCEWWL